MFTYYLSFLVIVNPLYRHNFYLISLSFCLKDFLERASLHRSSDNGLFLLFLICKCVFVSEKYFYQVKNCEFTVFFFSFHTLMIQLHFLKLLKFFFMSRNLVVSFSLFPCIEFIIQVMSMSQIFSLILKNLIIMPSGEVPHVFVLAVL